MKALVYTSPENLNHLDVPDPSPVPEESLVRIDSVGICGSDMHAWLGHDDRRPAPLILGHEAAGVVVGGPRDGERVTINPLVTCGKCRACREGRENLCDKREIISMPPREGAFAQYVAIPPDNLVPVPDGIPLERAALAEPLAVGWHAARLAREAVADTDLGTALVIGGGAIGVAAALALLDLSVDVTLVEPNTLRRDYLGNGAGYRVVDIDAVDGFFDVVVDAVGHDATRAMASARARPGGVITHVGLGEGSGGVDMRRVTLREITLIGTYAYTPRDFRETTEAMFNGRLGALDWTESRDLSDGAAAFHDIRAGRTAAPKVILKPWPS